MKEQGAPSKTSRRHLLQLSGASALGGLALGSLSRQALADEINIRVAYGSWIHGHSMEIEYPDRIETQVRRGFSHHVAGRPGTDNWFHFAIPTPVIINDVRLCLDSIMLCFVTESVDAWVRDVHVYDSEALLAVFDNVNMAEDNSFVRFTIPETPYVGGGIGISLGVSFGIESMSHGMDLRAAGADFIYNPIEQEDPEDPNEIEY